MTRVILARQKDTPIAKRIECQDLTNRLHAECRELFIRLELIQVSAEKANQAQAMGLECGDIISDILHHCHMALD